MRFVLVHNHIFKNAGSTVDAVFEKAGFRNTRIEATAEQPVVHPRRIVEAVLADPSVEYVSSHSLLVPRPDDREDVIFIDITFLRHPLDRLLSIYRYSRQPQVADFPAIPKNASFPQFIEGIERHAPAHLHSPQVVCLGDERKAFFPPGPETLARASATVARTRFLGVVDLFDESFRTFVSCNPWLFEGKDRAALAGPFEVVNRSPGGGVETREDLARELGAGRYERLERAYAADLALYEAAREEVLRRRAAALG